MVHGNPTWSFFFRRLVLSLRDRYRCLVPDHVGMGLSDRPRDEAYPYRLAQRVADLTRVIDALAPRGPVSLVLHDWGGMIGAGWATRHAPRLRAMAVMNTAAFHLPPDAGLPWQLRLSRGPQGATLVRGFNGFCRYAVRHCMARSVMPPEVRRAYLLPYNDWASRRAVHRFVQDIPLRPQHPSHDTVTRIEAALPALAQVPMLLPWGLRDFVFNEAYLRAWRERFPTATALAMSDVGHYVLEDAWEEVGPAITAFLDRHNR
jgi:haloalkane dehalogenase